ncbi:MAG TPA: NADPH-dependent FMN reductase [Hyphomonas atlantica]|uniref:NADPH-dependent FMN reductase n=1 Tax=Hyphomonas atlantica TaxID=1280948 RepID=A0A353YQ26_9PROT|nr:flavodoxin family protein [Hyphomonas atlantica]HBH45113.1 NADPH-dependent FMN reductase [Hyphomonas atlantica]HBQ47997.1 NADPH-dependent FMN reductase [Hyphomonas atlantica]|tara:strand:- start:1024 stop:1611 length:588 start_codon:yes stop_codon:yes gene_type:complete
MAKIAIVCHSGYGHTAKVAEHVRKGAASTGAEVTLYKAEDLASPESGPWNELNAADGIIFGAPTYMGSASAQMKQFLDATSKAWFTDAWKDKIAAGFTNSGSLAGDKSSTLNQFSTIAAQHGMVWVNFGLKSGFNASGHDFAGALNRAGFYNGLATQAMTDLSAEEGPDASDLKTAELFGERVANATLRWVRGAA